MEMVNVLEKVGEPDGELKPHDAPAGNPEHIRLTDWAGPFTKLTVIVIDPELPCTTVIPPAFEVLPEFDKRKSKPAGPLTLFDVMLLGKMFRTYVTTEPDA